MDKRLIGCGDLETKFYCSGNSTGTKSKTLIAKNHGFCAFSFPKIFFLSFISSSLLGRRFFLLWHIHTMHLSCPK